MTINQNEDSQAAKLQQLFSEVTENEREVEHIPEEKQNKFDSETDVLNLPPRSEVHSVRKKGMKMTLNWPLIRFLIVIIVLIAIVAGVYYLIGIDYFLS